MSTVFEVISTLEQLPVTTEVLEVSFLILSNDLSFIFL